MKPQIYVGCALTQASGSFRQFVADFKFLLAASAEVEVLEFLGLEKGTPAEVYDYDLGNVRKCVAMISFVDLPSIGLGMEIQEAIWLKKPILCLHHKGQSVTRMLIGAQDKHLLQLMEYQVIEDAVKYARSWLAFNELFRGPNLKSDEPLLIEETG
jgi:hypothetical protein